MKATPSTYQTWTWQRRPAGATTVTLKQVYQQADQEGMYRVVSEPSVLREA